MKSSLINKNIIILTLALVVSIAINAQVVRVIGNKGTLASIRNNQVTTAAIAPVNPLEGDVWFDTSGTTNVTKTFDGSSWISNSVNVYNGFFIITSSGVTTVSAIPFQPSQVSFVAYANIESLNINTDNGVGNNANPVINVQPTDIQNEDVVVLFTAYK
jgi:restriction endonuclease S subunit